MALYKLQKDPLNMSRDGSVRKECGNNRYLSIPLHDLTNTDYIEYKAWVDAGNTPEASD